MDDLHAHDLYCRCLAGLRDGLELASVPQRSLGPGSLFLTRHWTAGAMLRAVMNFRFRYGPDAVLDRPEIELVQAPYDASDGVCS